MSKLLSKVGIFFTYRVLKIATYLLESNILPDFLSRWGMRRLLETNLTEKNVEQKQAEFMAFVQCLKGLPIAINTADANEQVDCFVYVIFKFGFHSWFWPHLSSPNRGAGVSITSFRPNFSFLSWESE